MAVVLTQTGGRGKKLFLKMKLSASNLSGLTNVVGLWRMDTNEIVGHTNVAEDSASPTFTTEFHMEHYLSANLAVKLCAYAVKDGCVDETTFVGCYETTLGALFKGKQSEGYMGDTGSSLSFDVSVMPDPNQKKKEKKVETGPKLTKEEAKAIKECEKEGGKKGQDLCGMSAFGVHFFCVAIESCPDDWALFENVMLGMNKEVDPDGDDRKGGAADLAKILFCAGPTKLMIYANVPPELMEKASVKEFMEAVCDAVGATVSEIDDNFAKGEVMGDPDANKYPLKMRDAAIAAGFNFLRAKCLVLDDDSDDDINYADDCGIDLNAAPDAEDY